MKKGSLGCSSLSRRYCHVLYSYSGKTIRRSTASGQNVPQNSSFDQAPFWKTQRVPKGYWRDVQHQRELLESIAEALAIIQPSDWYQVSKHKVVKNGGGVLFSYYPSLVDALKAAYPDYPWVPSKFVTPASTGKKSPSKSQLLKALDTVAKVLGIKEDKPGDWYSVTLADLRQAGFPTAVTRAQLAELLADKFPQEKWEKVYLLRGRFAQQKRLENAIRQLFPEHEILVNARKEADLVNPTTGQYLELDIFVPGLNLAFEYQEQHHYTNTDYSYEPLSDRIDKDNVKAKLASMKNITLISIPCWWDGKVESLVATIQKERPDLSAKISDYINTVGTSIPDSAPPHYFAKRVNYIEDIGEPITATFFTLSDVNPTGWWMFEKYDGVRGFWNPVKKAFFSRSGKVIPLPQSIIDSMPVNTFLDGELWFGRDNFQEALKLSSRGSNSDVDWNKFKYMVFDVPNHKGTYAERYSLLDNLVSSQKQSDFLSLAPRQECESISHFEQFFQDAIDKGAEGVILRDPNALYIPGRSRGYLKHKKFRDGEAKIVQSLGNHLWECELPNGVRFTAAAGTTEFLRRYTPQPGSIVSFKHRGFLLATKKPKFATLYRLRDDITWADVVNNWKEQKHAPTVLPRTRRPWQKVKPRKYWMDVENRKKFFFEFAKEMGFDATDKEQWKSITKAQLLSVKGSGPLPLFNGSLLEALANTFPELGIKSSRDKALPSKRYDAKGSKYWEDIDNRRKYFEDFALSAGFDPLRPNNWRHVIPAQLIAHQGSGPLGLYEGSLAKALLETFPSFSSTEDVSLLLEQKRKKKKKNSKPEGIPLERQLLWPSLPSVHQ